MTDIIDLYPSDAEPLPDGPAPFPIDADPQACLNSPRGHYIVARALHLALRYIRGLAYREGPDTDRADMVFLLDNCFARHARVVRESEQMAGQGEPLDGPA